MNMKKIILIICVLVSIISCSKQDYYDIPKDANGNAILTGISSTTSSGISTLDGSFTVTATFATAKVGDDMRVELLKQQLPAGSTTTQLLPLAGTEKIVKVGSDMKATVTYTRDEAKMVGAGDNVTVSFNGATDYALKKVEMEPATTISKPKVGSKEVDVARTAETAFFNVTISPKVGAYTGGLVAKMKNGVNAAWTVVTGSPFTGTQPLKVPISGSDFAADKDTMFYSFSAASGSYTDEVTTTVIVRDPYFFVKKAGTLTLGGSSAGLNLIKNKAFAENKDSAQLAVAGSLILKGGSVWLAKAGNSVTFVPSISAIYDANNLTSTIDAFNAGSPVTSVDPGTGSGVFIYKIVNGPLDSDIYYGIIKVTSVVPNVSVSFEYRIGDKYSQLGEF